LAFASGPIDRALPIRRLSSAAGLTGELQAIKDARPAQNGSLSSEDQERLAHVLDTFPALLQASAESTLAMSQHLARNLHIGDSSALLYEATPRLVIASFDLTSGLAIDLRRNKVRALGHNSSLSAQARANLARSVADASIEGDMLMPKAQPRRIAAIDIFDQARTEGIRLIAVRSAGPLTTIQTSDLSRARMANAAPGSLLIAPERTPASASHSAWWQLDPSTGDAVSVLDTGLNGFQEFEEEAARERVISPMAYEVPAPTNNTISPLACEVATPWAQCVIFEEKMLAQLLDALVETGSDFELNW
jgi:hypothetical protein